MVVDKSQMGLTFAVSGVNRERQEAAVRAAGAQFIVHVGLDKAQCASWREAVRLARQGDVIRVMALSLVPTARGKDKTAPSGQPAEFILEAHERGGTVLETYSGRSSADPRQRRTMIADAVRTLRTGGRRLPASRNSPGRPPNQYSAEALAHNERVWRSRDYATNDAAERHMLEGMTAVEAWRRWGKSGRPWKRKRR